MDGTAPGYAKHPGYRIAFEPSAKRVRVEFGGEIVADTTAVRLLHETKHLPVYYFPRDDVRMDLLSATDHRSYCPFKGEASYWTVGAGGRTAENAVWSYEDPYDEVAEIAGYMAFYWDRMDAWYEEDEKVFVHARDPYTRIDIVRSARPVQVVVDGEVLAETERALFLVETGLPARYYIPRDDVRLDRLSPSDRTTQCPYKGTAIYWSVDNGNQAHADIVWSYPDPVAEVARIKDHLCFFNERVDAISIDGLAEANPKTKWS
ncbi:MAG: DUF427 domain-containing protein [Alphaproteobacteria bacterium]|nr:DUF427 domain-containing protein [Alphaproteobacteria bacterium]